MGGVAQSVEHWILNTLVNACRGLEFVFLVRRRSQVQVLPSARQFKVSGFLLNILFERMKPGSGKALPLTSALLA